MILSVLIPHTISHETHILDTAKKGMETTVLTEKKVGGFPPDRQRWQDTL